VSDLAELLRSVIARPDDHDVLRIYADALAVSGDLRGELIIVQLERLTADSEELIDREIELCRLLDAQIAGELGQPETTLEWYRGFIDVIDFVPASKLVPLGEAMRKLGVMPAARRLRRIVVRLVEPGWGPLGPVSAQLAKVAPQLRSLREVAFTRTSRDGRKPHVPTNFGELWPVCRAIPKLEVLELGGTDYSTTRDLDLASLKRLVLEDVKSWDLERIGRMSLPNLEELVLCGTQFGSGLEWFLNSRKPRLHALEIRTQDIVMRDLTSRLPRSAVFGTLTSLTLHGCDEVCVSNLVAHASSIRQSLLRRLRVEPISLAHIYQPISVADGRRLHDALAPIIVDF
jgi:uncharacterized protein (TIGR02996 family)